MIFAEIRVFGRALAVQQRIIGALFMREFMTRWGRRNLGFAWLFAEPLVFAFPVLLMWSIMRSPFEHGLPVMDAQVHLLESYPLSYGTVPADLAEYEQVLKELASEGGDGAAPAR